MKTLQKTNKEPTMLRRSLTVILCLATGVIVSRPGAATAQETKAASKETAAAVGKDLFDGKTLEGWKVAKFGGEGKVYVKDAAIVMETGNNMTGITWTGKPPRTNFELSLEGMRLEGSDFFCTTTFPVGKEYCSLVVGGWGGTVVGLSNVDFYDASDNSTSSSQDFKDHKWYRVRIRVTDAKIEAWIDDKQLIQQDRKGHQLGIRSEVDLNRPLGIATWCTKGAVRNIKLRELPAK
jgi:hypothetical protein